MSDIALKNFVECFLTKNDCYNDGRYMVVKGIMVHSTGANNPKVNRYVPIGENFSSLHWNKPGITKCVHGFLGKMPNGQIGFAQTLPWNKRGWHAGGYANNTHIGFEICEDDLTNKEYFDKVYNYAVNLCAYLCIKFKLAPLDDGVIICHQEGYRRNWASNHADVLHWFPKFGKSMDDFRIDVFNAMFKEDEDEMTQEKFNEFMNNWLTEQSEKPSSSWAIKQKVVEKGIALGISDGTMPQLYATREQVLAMILRAIANISKE